MRTELDVPFSHKEEAKALGAKWDRTKKIWYVPSGVNPEPFAEWLPGVDRSDPSAPYIYLVLGKRECWKCHKETSVAAFGIPYRTDNDESIAINKLPALEFVRVEVASVFGVPTTRTDFDQALFTWARDHHAEFHKQLGEGIYL